jgi:AAA domain
MTMLFQKAEVTTAFLKMGMMGFQGSGKTHTATSTAIGLVTLIKQLRLPYADRPIFFADTETGSDWVIPRIRKAGLELFTAKTRAFADLLKIVPEAEDNSSLLLIDSLSHFWVELCDSYMKRKNRTRLQFEDWAFLKVEWRKFTDLFINSKCHIIVCGRAGYEYDYTTDEDTGKKNLEKTGIKMKAEGEMGYEPSLLVLMERRMEMETKTDRHFANVIKDRSTLLDGKEFADPTFENFLPHIQCLNLGGRQLGVDISRTSEHTIPADIRDNRRTQRKIVLAEIEDLLVTHYPGQTSKEKLAKVTTLKTHWSASWVEMEEVMPLERLRAGYDMLHRELEGKPSRYADQLAPKTTAEIDSLPDSVMADPLAIPASLDRRFFREKLPMHMPVTNGQIPIDDWLEDARCG